MWEPDYLTPEERRERDQRIAAAYRGGETQREIAARLGISQTAVYRALQRAGVEARPAARRPSPPKPGAPKPPPPPDVPRLLGVSYRQLDYWCRRGYLRPITPGGSGNPRRWPEAELEVARRMATLVRSGYQAAAAAQLARLGGEVEEATA
jgi:transposase-like protein